MIYKLFKAFSLLFLLTVASCFQNADQSLKEADNSSNAPVSEILPTQFSGALDASNKVTGIQVRWSPASTTVSVYRVYRLQGRKLNLIATLPSSVSSFIDGDVTWGSTYNYVVKAVDLKGLEDANTKTVSSLAWGGIGSVQSDSRDSIRVVFDSPTPVADEIRVYLTSKNTRQRVLAATVDGSTTEVLIENLKAGYGYYVTAQAYVGAIKKEDGNDVQFEISTETEGYHANDVNPPGWKSIINIRAFGDSPNSPVHPITPEKNPQSRVVELAFNAFSNTDATAQYVVIRSAYPNSVDTSVSTGCTETTLTSCKVCDLSGNSNLFCRDTHVAAAPIKYRYTMALVRTDTTTSETWVEPVPQDKLDQFTLSVPIPPDNMVLMHRAAANYEMCSMINQIPDPLNFNRCAYAGIGGSPYSTGHNKSPLNLTRGYYDSGFNLFIDRYPLACNWTKAISGGMCGAGATAGDCIGNTAPSNTIGKEMDVFFRIDNPGASSWGAYCYVKRDNVWMTYDTLVDTKTNNGNYLRGMFTSDPKAQGGQRPIVQVSMAPATTVEVCKAFTHPTYGAKRLMRLREYRSMTAMPTVPGDPYYMTYAKALGLRAQSTTHDASNGYGCDLIVNDTHPTSLAAMLAPTNEISAYMNGALKMGQSRFYLGAVSSIDCQSRYGFANNFSSATQTVSDSVEYDATAKRYTGQISPIDNGNRDLLTDINGGLTGFKLDSLTPVTDVNGLTYFYMGSSTFFNYVALPLGLPILSNTATGYYSRNLFLERYSDIFYTYPSADSPVNNGARQFVVNSRWETNIRASYFVKQGGGMIRCVLPAE